MRLRIGCLALVLSSACTPVEPDAADDEGTLVTSELLAGAVLRVGFGEGRFGDLTVTQVSSARAIREEPPCVTEGDAAKDYFVLHWTPTQASGEVPSFALSVRDVGPLVSFDDTTCTDLARFPLEAVEPGVQRLITAAASHHARPRVLSVSLDDGLEVRVHLAPACSPVREPTQLGLCVIEPITFQEGTAYSKAVPAP